MLKKQYPSIKWASENAKVAEINPEGRAGLGYDIEYIDENGNRRFVEVKASKTSDIVFYMSIPILAILFLLIKRKQRKE